MVAVERPTVDAGVPPSMPSIVSRCQTRSSVSKSSSVSSAPSGISHRWLPFANGISTTGRTGSDQNTSSSQSGHRLQHLAVDDQPPSWSGRADHRQPDSRRTLAAAAIGAQHVAHPERVRRRRPRPMRADGDALGSRGEAGEGCPNRTSSERTLRVLAGSGLQSPAGRSSSPTGGPAHRARGPVRNTNLFAYVFQVTEPAVSMSA